MCFLSFLRLLLAIKLFLRRVCGELVVLDSNILVGNLILFDFLDCLLIKLELDVNFAFVADIWFLCILPNIMIDFIVLVLLNIVIDNDMLESVREIGPIQPDTSWGPSLRNEGIAGVYNSSTNTLGWGFHVARSCILSITSVAGRININLELARLTWASLAW